MSTVAPALLTAEEFVARHAGDSVELIDGEVKELPMAQVPHGVVIMRFGYHVTHYVETNSLGRVASNDTFVLTKRNPDRVRGADIAYWSFERIPKGRIPDGLIQAPPELVAEIMSPTDRWRDVHSKVTEYLQAGVDVVVVFDSPAGVATVFRPDEYPQVFHNSDVLIFPDILPGFSLPLPKLFEDVTR